MKKLIVLLLALTMAVSAAANSALTAYAVPVDEEQPVAAQAEEQTVEAPAEEQSVEAEPEEQSVAAEPAEQQNAEDYPKVNYLQNCDDGVQIGWTRYPGAVKYRVFIKSGNTWKGIGNSECLSLRHKVSQNNTTFIYTVRAIGKDGSFISSYNKEGYSHLFVVTPEIRRIENVDGGATLSWNPRQGVRYRLFYLDSENRWRSVARTTATSYTHKNLKNGETLTYTLRYENSSGVFVSPYNAKGWKNTYIAPPVISSVTRDKTVLNVKWNVNRYAERYRVYRKQGSGKWVNLGDTYDTTYTDKNLFSGVKYTYVVRAINAKATRFTSAFSNQRWKIAVTASNMSEKNKKLRENMISFLSKQVGNNNRRYIDHINEYGGFGLGYGTQWCAVFGWSAVDMFTRTQSNVTNLIPPRWHVSEIANESRVYGAWHNTFSTDYEAKPGDLFMTSFYKYPYDDGRTHVGYIEYVDKDENGKVTYIHTVEGNFNWEIGDNSETVVGRSCWKDRLEKDHGAMVTDYIDLEKIVKIK